MCGIVGLFVKNPELECKLGRHVAAMLLEMSERGPDSAGAAVYRDEVAGSLIKLTLFSSQPEPDWQKFSEDLQAFDSSSTVVPRLNHAVVQTAKSLQQMQTWLQGHSDIRINSSGKKIEIYKEKGSPASFIDSFNVADYTGTHALGHTRMATESAVTTEHSHPFSTGDDLCCLLYTSPSPRDRG